MAIEETQCGQNFNHNSTNMTNQDGFIERNKLAFTIMLVAISIFLLGIQLMPYIYGGSLGHFHSSGVCSWPNDCSSMSSFVSF